MNSSLKSILGESNLFFLQRLSGPLARISAKFPNLTTEIGEVVAVPGLDFGSRFDPDEASEGTVRAPGVPAFGVAAPNVLSAESADIELSATRLNLFRVPVGSERSSTFALSSVPTGGVELSIRAFDIDAPAEAELLLNGQRLQLPEGIYSDGRTPTDTLAIAPELLQVGENVLTFVFADNLNGTTQGYRIRDLEISPVLAPAPVDPAPAPADIELSATRLNLFRVPVGSERSSTFALSSVPTGGVELSIRAFDIDAPAEAELLLNGQRLQLPEGIYSDGGTPTDTLAIAPELLQVGENVLTFVFADNLNGTTQGYRIRDLVVSPLAEDVAANTAPVATDDSASIAEDSSLTISFADLLANDSDLDGDTLTVTTVGTPANGSVTTNGNGTLTYAPAPNFNGSDTFTYTIEDGNGGTATASVDIAVTPVNDAPLAIGDSFSVEGGSSLTIDAADLLANDSDLDGDTLTVTTVGTPANGSIAANGNGTFTYTPDGNFVGQDSFDYVISDGTSTDEGTVDLTVTSPPPLTSAFNIEVNFTDNSLTPSQQAIFTDAANRWAEVILEDLPDVSVNVGGSIIQVDDVRIDASAPNIDGAGGVLGQAGPTSIRPRSSASGASLPATGIMQFDAADLDNLERNGRLEDVILHEMGHVLGIGTLWGFLGLLSGAGTSNPQYTGDRGTAEYNAIFGLNAPSVPVENTGGPGTRDGHWRESVFGNELMTGFLSGGTNPLSRVTIGQLDDLGYGVNLDAADFFAPPNAVVANTASQPANLSTAGSLSGQLLADAGHASACSCDCCQGNRLIEEGLPQGSGGYWHGDHYHAAGDYSHIHLDPLPAPIVLADSAIIA